MKKRYPLFLFLFVLAQACFAQTSNGVDVRNFLSPLPNVNLDSSEVANVEIRFRNDGPASLLGQDTILFQVTIGFGDSTEFYFPRIPVNAFLQPNDIADYVVLPNYQFDVESSYSICVSVSGTTTYPSNITKNARSCVSFFVGLEDLQLQLEQVYYADGEIRFNLGQATTGNLQILDITGRSLFQKKARFETDTRLRFQAPAKGFYFLKLSLKNGKSGIAKFVVN